MTEQGTELVTAEERIRRFIDEWDRMSHHDEQIHSIGVQAGIFTLTTTDIRAALSEARRLALAEGLDVERLARATRNAGYLFKRRDSRHQTPVYLEVAVEAIADEYARLTEEARHDPQ